MTPGTEAAGAGRRAQMVGGDDRPAPMCRRRWLAGSDVLGGAGRLAPMLCGDDRGHLDDDGGQAPMLGGDDRQAPMVGGDLGAPMLAAMTVVHRCCAAMTAG